MQNPPITITENIINLVSEISEYIGVVSVNSKNKINPHLRKDNQIKTIHSSLAIENNSLSLKQVTDIISGKRVLGRPFEIKEVQNAFQIYDNLELFNPYSIDDLLRAHKILMSELTKEAGRYRNGNVGIFAGENLIHMGAMPMAVPELIQDLFEWIEKSKVHPLIKSCVFHYEFEFIHPFADGNGRMGRLWQTLILSKWKEVFAWLPVETLIKDRQEEYYKVLGIVDKESESTVFVEFMLTAIRDSLKELREVQENK